MVYNYIYIYIITYSYIIIIGYNQGNFWCKQNCSIWGGTLKQKESNIPNTHILRQEENSKIYWRDYEITSLKDSLAKAREIFEKFKTVFSKSFQITIWPWCPLFFYSTSLSHVPPFPSVLSLLLTFFFPFKMPHKERVLLL